MFQFEIGGFYKLKNKINRSSYFLEKDDIIMCFDIKNEFYCLYVLKNNEYMYFYTGNHYLSFEKI